jgi:hypothetical protein
MRAGSMSEEEPKPMSLEQLNGAILRWEDADGNEHKVEFSDS